MAAAPWSSTRSPPAKKIAGQLSRQGLRLVAETAVEDGRLTKSQLLAMIDGIVEAADAWQAALWAGWRSVGGKRASA